MEVHSHRENEEEEKDLVTFLFHEFGSFTFKLEKGIDLRMKATYEGMLEDVFFTADIRYEGGKKLKKFFG